MNNEELVIRIKAGDNTAENMAQLYDQVKGFIHSVAWRFRGREELEDLEQEGYLALYDAIDGFDPAMGYKFLTYAEYWIVQRMQRYIDGNSSNIRIPVHCRERIRKYRRLCDSFMKEYSREPSDREAAAHLGLNKDQVRQLQKDSTAALVGSLDSPVHGQEAEGITIGDTVKADTDLESSILEEVQAEQLKTDLWGCVDSLKGMQPDVIRKKYQNGLTLQAIGDGYGVSREAVRQIESKALRELRKPRNCKRLQPYLEEVRSAAMRGTGVERFRQTWTSATERAALDLVDPDARFREHEKWLEEYRQRSC